MTPPLLQRLRRHARWGAPALLALIGLTAYAIGWFDRTPESFRETLIYQARRSSLT
ncbi:hypothetical protein HI806_19860 (plasmid) [Ralstonia solanacearum]|nr:hypothetical protein HI806_19860 [Ralstonia solanacearum]QKL78628.1 hypothetical protein HI805_19865 [Ralstonia solanacearum]QKL83835.1 hypothetical protein HI804_19870 [Ralstonia solanacearum]QKL89045.1 hypothetical protein HI803_19875 [Ralstonia solanacearum]QKM04413.1 hypothetical protein HI800_19870 [Ralstonia solanacearum]